MTTAVPLYTMRCKIACAHCSVNFGPGRRGAMAPDVARAGVDALATMPDVRYIDLSGGEPLLHPDEIMDLIGRIKAQVKSARLTTNGFWAASPQRGAKMLRRLKAAGLDAVGLSLDKWHLDFPPAGVARHFSDAARATGFAPLVSCVVGGSFADPRPGASEELTALLDYCVLSRKRATDLLAWERHMDGLDPAAKEAFLADIIRGRLLVNWQYLTGEGRAAEMPRHETDWRTPDATPDEHCGIAGRVLRHRRTDADHGPCRTGVPVLRPTGEPPRSRLCQRHVRHPEPRHPGDAGAPGLEGAPPLGVKASDGGVDGARSCVSGVQFGHPQPVRPDARPSGPGGNGPRRGRRAQR
jgi:hypothetical protein